ncbi:MAG: redoxin family protein [Crocinitomicaceae bacterium]|nr:redoxin family protein [Crocinitomicaceae bacterium]
MKSFSKRKLSKAVFIGLIMVPTMLLIQSSQLKKGGKDLKIGKKAPMTSTSLTGVDGNSYNLDKLTQENGLIVIFTCNTCPFVVGNDSFEGWEKQYNEIYKTAKANKMGVVLINSNEAKRTGVDSSVEMKKHSENKGYTMPYVVDKDSKLANAFGAKTTPHAFILDKNKKLVYKGSIDNSWDTKKTELTTYLYNAIAQLAEGKTIEENSTAPRGCSIKRTK